MPRIEELAFFQWFAGGLEEGRRNVSPGASGGDVRRRPKEKRPRSLGAVFRSRSRVLELGTFRPLNERAVRVDDVVVEVGRGTAHQRAAEVLVAATRSDVVVVARG